MPSETIGEQLKVLSTLGRQELQTGARSEAAEPTELLQHEFRGGFGGPWASMALKGLGNPEVILSGHPGWPWLWEGGRVPGTHRWQRRTPTQWFPQLLLTVTTQSRPRGQRLGDSR